MDRYQRQIILPGMGIEGQKKLAQTSVLVVGAGGLGCPVLLQCALMGIGTIGIVDSDKVALHNLHRQSLYDENSVGCYKVDVAKQVLAQKNTTGIIQTYNLRIDATNIFDILESYDLVVDATDNFVSRYIINDACVAAGKVLVYGAVFQYEGQMAVFNYPTEHGRSAHYRDIFAHPPQAQGISCAETGVLGVLTHSIGNMMAAEIFKIATGIGEISYNKIVHYHLLTQAVQSFEILPSSIDCTIDRAFVRNYPYAAFCGEENLLNEADVLTLIHDPNTLLVDLRQETEVPQLLFPHKRIIMEKLWEQNDWWGASKNIIFVCQSGNRSKTALQEARQKFPALGWYAYKNGVKTLNELYEQKTT